MCVAMSPNVCFVGPCSAAMLQCYMGHQMKQLEPVVPQGQPAALQHLRESCTTTVLQFAINRGTRLTPAATQQTAAGLWHFWCHQGHVTMFHVTCDVNNPPASSTWPLTRAAQTVEDL